ncbi:hypothetical protein D9757_009818 [Collybiopsis confluens]|uniref:Uncharacterized protein n=1 Tax=Collybiopsis confluens TaxID=2823264 RepID=A0A8H5HFF8_9AGAR|nr:hypothetical protein D9757_009818 [Collybiopsis confluens]
MRSLSFHPIESWCWENCDLPVSVFCSIVTVIQGVKNERGAGNGTNTGNKNSGSNENSASLYCTSSLSESPPNPRLYSLLPRRRHRLSGLYPTNILAGARGKVDLAKNPRMWEANVDRPSWNSHHSHTTSSSISDNRGGKQNLFGREVKGCGCGEDDATERMSREWGIRNQKRAYQRSSCYRELWDIFVTQYRESKLLK